MILYNVLLTITTRMGGGGGRIHVEMTTLLIFIVFAPCNSLVVSLIAQPYSTMFTRAWHMLKSRPLAAATAMAAVPAVALTSVRLMATPVTPAATDAPKSRADDTSLPPPKAKKSKKSKKNKKKAAEAAAGDNKGANGNGVAEKAAALHAAGWEDDSLGSEPCAWSADQMLRPYGARNISQVGILYPYTVMYLFVLNTRLLQSPI
jgi:hypothetical protein